MERISRGEQYMRIADIIALRGSCQRAQVGCVIVREGRIVSTGYNGPLGDNCELTCDTDNPCINAIHAEANAIYFASKHGISLEGCTLYCNYSPCKKCSEAIIQSGIVKVVFRELYRDSLFDLLNAANIVIEQLKWGWGQTIG